MSKHKKRGPGRPKLNSGEAKSVLIQVRVTPEEAKTIEQQAATSRKPRSEWIRRRLVPPAPGEGNPPAPPTPAPPT